MVTLIRKHAVMLQLLEDIATSDCTKFYFDAMRTVSLDYLGT